MGMSEDVKCNCCGSKYFMGYRNCMCESEPQQAPSRYARPSEEAEVAQEALFDRTA